MADEPQVTNAPIDHGSAPANLQFLQVKSNEMLRQEELAKTASEAILVDPDKNSSLGMLINQRFQRAENAKDHVTDKQIAALRRRKGEYSAAHFAEIKKQGGSDIFMKLTEIKCNAAEAWISDVVVPDDDKPWQIKPTPRPDLPPQVVDKIIMDTVDEFEQRMTSAGEDEIREVAGRLRDEQWAAIRKDAKQRAERMENLISDEFVQGDFLEAMEECISDLVTYGTMIMKGPFIQMTKVLDWLEEKDWTPNPTMTPMMKFRRVDPLNFFPSPGASSIKDAIYMLERDEFSRHALFQMKDTEGYNNDLIEKCLEENRAGTTIPLRTDSEQATLEDRQGSNKLENADDKYQALWYCGQCEGHILKEWGLKGLNDNDAYEIVALKVGSYVIHARLNPDPLGDRFYSKAVYKPVKGSFWGAGVPELMEDSQDACNSTARALINNLAIASGPQVGIRDVEALADGENITTMHPWKIWQFADPSRTGKGPIEFFQPQINSAELMKVFEFFEKKADEETGIPKYETGTTGTGGIGAAKTSSGLAMLMNNASRVLKKSIKNVDNTVIRPMVQRAFVWNMLYVDDPTIKGDVQIEASGAMGMFVKEQRQLRLAEYIALTSNPDDRAIIGQGGRAELLRAAGKGLDVAIDKIVPTNTEIEDRAKEEAANAEEEASLAAGPPAPVAGAIPAGPVGAI